MGYSLFKGYGTYMVYVMFMVKFYGICYGLWQGLMDKSLR